MKTQSTAISSGLLRPSTLHRTDGAKVTIGPKVDSDQQVIKVNRTAEGVESIEVVCSCGERIVIRCEYE